MLEHLFSQKAQPKIPVLGYTDFLHSSNVSFRVSISRRYPHILASKRGSNPFSMLKHNKAYLRTASRQPRCRPCPPDPYLLAEPLRRLPLSTEIRSLDIMQSLSYLMNHNLSLMV